VRTCFLFHVWIWLRERPVAEILVRFGPFFSVPCNFALDSGRVGLRLLLVNLAVLRLNDVDSAKLI
jgi:hypothetical protein